MCWELYHAVASWISWEADPKTAFTGYDISLGVPLLSTAIEEKRKQEGQWEKGSCDAGSTNPSDALEFEWPFPGCPGLV